MINCSSVFLMLFILCILFLSTSSRKNNFCVFLSLILSIALSWILYAFIFRNGFLDESALYFGKLFSHLSNFPTDKDIVISFSYGYWMGMITFFSFILFECIFVHIFRLDYYFMKKTITYHWQKFLLVFCNLLMIAYALFFIIGSWNIAYQMPKGFLGFIFDIVTEGILKL